MLQLIKKTGEGLLLAGVCFLLFLLFFEHRIQLPAWVQVIGRMHPMLLHFPIVLLLLYFFALWMPAKESDTWIDVVRLLASMMAVLTAIMGLLLSLEEKREGSTFFWHKWGGIAIALVAFSLYYLHPFLIRRKWVARPLTIVISFLVIMTGHWGAHLTHGENYLLAPLESKERETVPLEQAVAFKHFIQPILKTKCSGCHGRSGFKGGLIMDDSTSILKGGKTGPLFIAGQPEKSLLIKRILLPLYEKKHMPLKTKPQLTDDEIKLLSTWIKAGAPFQKKITDLPALDSFRILAASYLSPSTTKEQIAYDFPPADESKIKALNNNYRLVSPLGIGIPALTVQFYGKNGYSAKALEELLQVKEQIVELNLARLPVKNEDLKTVQRLQNLKRLNLNYTDVTDTGLLQLTALKKLQKISIAGTPVSQPVARQLLNLPELTTLYIWNTKLDSADIAALRKDHKQIKIETGYKDDGKLILPLNPPIAKTTPGINEPSSLIELKHSYRGAEIRYTLDGKEPDSLNSALYKTPIQLEQFALVKAKAYKPGWYGSKTLKAVYFTKGLKPDSVFLVANEESNKGKDKLLVDADIGDANLTSGKWLGFKETGTSYLYFNKPVTVQQLIVHAFVNMDAYIFHPAKIEVWGGMDKSKLKLLNSYQKTPPTKKDEEGLVEPRISFASTTVKCIKLVIHPLSKIPRWHPKSYPPKAFISEVFIY